MNKLTEQNYDAMADDSECTDDVTGAMGCLVFLGFVVFVAIAAISLISKWISK